MKFVIVIILLLAVFAGLSWYIAHRIYQGFNFFFVKLSFVPLAATVGAFTFVVLLSVARSFIPFPKGVSYALGVIGGYCMGVLLYLLLFTIAADLIIVIMSLFKFNLPLLRGIMTIGVLLSTLVTSVYGFVNARQIEHTSYKISIERKTDISNLKLVMISDLHLGAIGSEGRLESIVDEIMPSIASELPVVVLDHNPKHINSYDVNTDLILCGHTHKGQVFPINLITNAIFTVDYGYYRKDTSSPHIVVSSGVGTWGMPMRVGSHSEIVSITFECND